MKNKHSAINKMLILSISFTTILIAVRIIISSDLTYIFLGWNMFLAILPLCFSRMLLHQKQLKSKAVIFLFLWLLFYPNAPYIVTDLFHYTERPPIPYWFDLLIVTSAVWNGLILGLISLMEVESFLANHLSAVKVKLLISVSFILCGYGIYIGRFLRYNSWDIVTNPIQLSLDTISRIVHPFHHPRTWAFTILFAAMMALFYYTIKSLSFLFQRKELYLVQDNNVHLYREVREL